MFSAFSFCTAYILPVFVKRNQRVRLAFYNFFALAFKLEKFPRKSPELYQWGCLGTKFVLQNVIKNNNWKV